MSPDPCSDFSSSSFDPSDHSPPTITPNPITATPDPVPQPPPYVPSSLPCLLKCRPLPPRSSQPPSPACARLETSDPPSTPRVPRLYPDLPRSPPRTQSWTTLKQETSPQDPTPFPAPLLPLWEVAGAEGIIWVHVPFSLTNLSQAEKHLGSFSSDPDNYLKEFKRLTQSYNLTWDIYIILSSTLLLEEKERL